MKSEDVKSETDVSSFSSTKNNNSRTQIQKLTLIVSITALVIFGFFIAVPSTIIVAQLRLPSSSTSSNTTKTATSTAPNATTTAKPVDGYNTHLSALRHVFDDPSLRVQHYCKANNKIVWVCQLYDSTSSNATLIGIEYIITADQYKSLPNREKPNWIALGNITHNRANPIFPELSAAQVKLMGKVLFGTHGKVIITWDPRDKLPAFPPQTQGQSPFMLNATVKPEIHAGSFNQTLKY
jgi:hypothetical protein